MDNLLLIIIGIIGFIQFMIVWSIVGTYDQIKKIRELIEQAIEEKK